MNAIARKLDAIKEKGRITAVDVANFLNTRPETVSRWRQGKAFPRPDAQKRLMELEYIVDQLSDIYTPEEARLWLNGRQKLLDGSVPTALIQDGRTDEVIAVVEQLRQGVFI
jgi:transcriptional regulator with XRE-family HTH domain